MLVFKEFVTQNWYFSSESYSLCTYDLNNPILYFLNQNR